MSKSESSRYATLSTWQPWQSLEIHIGSCLLTMAPDTISLADYIKDVLILLSMYSGSSSQIALIHIKPKKKSKRQISYLFKSISLNYFYVHFLEEQKKKT